MQATHSLVHDYRQDIVRQVEEIENGVVTTTRSPKNPEAVAVIRKHVEEMKGVIESGGRVRVWDPLFAEIFEHSDEIVMEIEPLEDGVRVIETSENPEVVKLIQAHAWKVNEFVARGPAGLDSLEELRGVERLKAEKQQVPVLSSPILAIGCYPRRPMKTV